MKVNYLVWTASSTVPNAVGLDRLTGFDRVIRLWRGEPLAGKFPDDAEFRMRSDFPENTVLTDNLANLHSLLVGSQRLKDFLEGREVSDVEYHRVAIRDHKRKVIKSQYYIINPIRNIDCLDLAASGAEMSDIAPEKVQFIKKVVLRDEALDSSRQIFRITNFNMITLVREDLAGAVDQAGFTGVRFVETSKYPR